MITNFSKQSISVGKKTNLIPNGIRDGSTQEKAAANGAALRSLGLPDGMYWINVGGVPKKVYCDLTTASTAWYLIAWQGASNPARDMSVESTGGYSPLLRHGVNGLLEPSSVTNNYLFALPLINSSTQLAFSWNQNTFTSQGNMLSYDNAVSFPTPGNQMDFNGAVLEPPVGSTGNNFNIGSTDPNMSSFSLTNIKGSHGLATGTWYTRKKSFTLNYGNSYGIVRSPGTTQLDWGPDAQTFGTIYFSRNGNTNSNYVTASGTGSGYVPAAIALWARSA